MPNLQPAGNECDLGPEFELVQHPFTFNGRPAKRFFVPKCDDVMAIYIKTARPWEYKSLVALYQGTARGGAFVEVGANLGTDTVLAAEFFTRCYVFEPSPRHLPVLRKNLEINGVTHVKVFPMGVSNQCGTAKLYHGPADNTGGASLVPAGPTDPFVEVPITTLDAALPEITDVTFIHIDAEGHDIKVLQGARQFMHRQKQRPVVKIEFQPRSLAEHGSHVAELIALIDEFKFHVMFSAANYLVPLSRGMLIEMFNLWQENKGWIDLYLSPP